MVIRAEASPDWALGEIRGKVVQGEIEDAREMAESLLPFWRASIARQSGSNVPSQTAWLMISAGKQ